MLEGTISVADIFLILYSYFIYFLKKNIYWRERGELLCHSLYSPCGDANQLFLKAYFNHLEQQPLPYLQAFQQLWPKSDLKGSVFFKNRQFSPLLCYTLTITPPVKKLTSSIM